MVDRENNYNWRWFLELLAVDLDINNSQLWAFMSDRQKAMSPGAYGFLQKIAPEHCVILGARSKGIVTLNEIIRTKLMCRIQKKRDAMQKCGSEYCPRIMKKLEKAKALSFTYSTTWSGGAQYQVLGNEGQFVVDRIEKTCSCRKWQLTGVPCAHAISALYYNQDRPENYIDECYKVSTFLAIYSHILYPTQDRSCWPSSNQSPMIPPPPVNNKRGKKTMLRRREPNEEAGYTKGKVSMKGRKITCSICGVAGHNKRFHGIQVPLQLNL
ncbi:uncharacterized protein LOC120281132 [Dioscorea cayenensis subsp. rotundata]|uniref:Uncharacterized protein LOC120281132 n=1 Tax=Dioscorea cayennensis subsp. rotundata TaxID=55577 RepID=A0AB40CVJ0_DIOCR|nr:uncharacterized protein LOC120281132 [Dioscorea cayenensis subsp. rotundata]